jgi:hypothetical protein
MKEDGLDKMIKDSLNTSPPGMEIDIRRETMSRIEAYEQRKSKGENLFLWVLSVFTFCAGLVSIFIFEGFISLYEDFFLRTNLDMTTVKLVFQGVFLIFILISLTVMISQKRPSKHLNRFLFILSF